jgi:acetoin utilization deacetylase AcuC-like enzyme/GNAT superfamily N-acetyltransferase
MFRIRQVFDDSLPVNRRVIAQVQDILRTQFSGVRDKDIASLPNKLRNPLRYNFRHILLVADDLHGTIRGFALISHDAELQFCFLDYLASAKHLTGGGVGGALYQRVRDQARRLEAIGLLFECSPDEPGVCESPEQFKANVARLRFYERYGARPIINNDYRKPIRPTDRSMPYLMFDDLDTGRRPRRESIRKIVRAVLERKYARICSPEYVTAVVESFRDDPIRLREFKYLKAPAPPPRLSRKTDRPIVLVVNDRHLIHHVHERGYVEAPVRIPVILQAIEDTGLFLRISPKEYPESYIRAVHDGPFVDYLKRVCQGVPQGKSVYPYVFPIRNAARPPKELAVRAGYYCIDTFTPLNQNAYLAAKRAVDCALTAADVVLHGQHLAYALIRPPGHHAERRVFGGFCYFNSTAIAADYLSRHGRVAILDIDYHHGNGEQDVFYERNDVLTISIHGHPHVAYPYFSGFEDEKGSGPGHRFNVNYPLPEHVEGPRYHQTLERALGRIRRFSPTFLVVAMGLDPAKGDPTGTWSLTAKDFAINGRMIGALRLPTLIVQEGGYRTRTLGINARHFFVGLVDGMLEPPLPKPASPDRSAALSAVKQTPSENRTP